jgi:hypothetical protein
MYFGAGRDAVTAITKIKKMHLHRKLFAALEGLEFIFQIFAL